MKTIYFDFFSVLCAVSILLRAILLFSLCPFCCVGCLPVLRTLTITHNKIKTAEDLQGLLECRELSCLDLSHNKIDDPAVMDIFCEMPSLVRCF